MAVPEGTHPDPSPYQSKQHREGATAASPPSAAAPTMPKLDASSPITSRRGVCLQLDFLGLRDAEWSVLNVPWRRLARNVVPVACKAKCSAEDKAREPRHFALFCVSASN